VSGNNTRFLYYWMSGDDQSRTLAELRDTLLPKLISGQVRVPDAEQFVEEVL